MRRAAAILALVTLFAGSQAHTQDGPSVAPSNDAPLPPPKLSDIVPPIPTEPVVSPFGDRHDPTRPVPVEPQTKGPGILAATLVAAGPADVQQLPKPPNTGSPLYAVVVDVTLAASSTTDVLGASSIQLHPASGDPVPLFAACLPSLEDNEILYRGKGSTMASWDVAIGSRTLKCGGRSARLLIRVGEGGFRLTNSSSDAWAGSMLLLFEGQAAPPKSAVVAGRTVEIPPPDGKGAAAN